MIGVIASRHRQTKETRFVSTWNVATDNELVTLPISKLYKIDWGDGTTTTDQTSHTYANSGTYQIKIEGVVDDWNFYNYPSDKDKILSLDSQGGLIKLNNGAFQGCSNLVSVSDINIEGKISQFIFAFCSSLVSVGSIKSTNYITYGMFANCTSLVSVDFTDWEGVIPYNGLTTTFQNTLLNDPTLNLLDVSTCTWLGSTFKDCSSLNIPLDSWDTSNVTSFSRMFLGAISFNQDVSMWDFTSALNISEFMTSKTFNDYNYQYYDNLLIRWDNQLDVPNMTNKTVSMGTIKYSSKGAAARDSLISKGLIITDGGLI